MSASASLRKKSKIVSTADSQKKEGGWTNKNGWQTRVGSDKCEREDAVNEAMNRSCGKVFKKGVNVPRLG